MKVSVTQQFSFKRIGCCYGSTVAWQGGNHIEGFREEFLELSGAFPKPD